MVTRRRFIGLAVPGLLALSGGTLICGCKNSACPLSSQGYCTGPCTAYLDDNGNLVCDRVDSVLASAKPSEPATIEPTPVPQPEPSPDAGYESDNDAATDSPTAAPTEEATSAPTATKAPASTAAPQPTQSAPQVSCPFGLVNDPYPGKCGRYVDKNDNGFCDYSEPSGRG